ncbi:hypothetical protein DDB_G0267652 [Dictyostelium discoideum AX4]|uniref:Uncharacterized protein n=1 Tax=Dictyostelium discoideum TaxID=44689 RepID=Q55GJ0_DICDI|nr:hypothetical protein DDB_G0267652 [Dictyostelium discoideum AX4]EAL73279.1 hypothetical protein DDB_G0267652 [Dictyostelium discoideum AX4]|eukprot:XP_647194.1 hypothetical protein DDB_G0267652 [Dictyostelium discoideum AX4]
MSTLLNTTSPIIVIIRRKSPIMKDSNASITAPTAPKPVSRSTTRSLTNAPINAVNSEDLPLI